MLGPPKTELEENPGGPSAQPFDRAKLSVPVLIVPQLP